MQTDVRPMVKLHLKLSISVASAYYNCHLCYANITDEYHTAGTSTLSLRTLNHVKRSLHPWEGDEKRLVPNNEIKVVFDCRFGVFDCDGAQGTRLCV
jgi:hypothetical protein